MATITTRHYYPEPIPAPEPEKPPRRSRAEQARINGAKSRGPKTDEGKAIVSQNARKHGLAAKLLLVDSEHEDSYNEIEKGLANSFKPQTEAEDLLIEQIAKITWKLRQANNMEMDLLRDNIEQGDSIHSAFSYDPASLMLLSTYQARLARQMHKLYAELRKVQTETAHPMKEAVSLRSAHAPFQSEFPPFPSHAFEDHEPATGHPQMPQLAEIQESPTNPQEINGKPDPAQTPSPPGPGPDMTRGPEPQPLSPQPLICKNKPKSEPEPPKSKPEQTHAHSEESQGHAGEPHGLNPPLPRASPQKSGSSGPSRTRPHALKRAPHR